METVLLEKPREELSLRDKLMLKGTEWSHRRHLILLRQCRCPSCQFFFGRWAASNFDPTKKPQMCFKCGFQDPLGYARDPLDDIKT